MNGEHTCFLMVGVSFITAMSVSDIEKERGGLDVRVELPMGMGADLAIDRLSSTK